jgi:hypothetical protein
VTLPFFILHPSSFQVRRFAMQRSVLLFLILCFLVPALALAESESEKKKKAEEAMRLEAKALAEAVQEHSSLVSLQGRFTVAKELAGDDKPLPKVIGYLSADGTAYPVMVNQPSILAMLLGMDGKDVTVSGRIMDKGDQGKFIIATAVIVPSAGPQVRRKRGGLP